MGYDNIYYNNNFNNLLKMKDFIKKLTTMMLFALIALSISSCRPKHVERNDSSVDSDTISQYVPTIAEVLQEREDLKYSLFIDSVYTHMPLPILINILSQKDGTLMDIQAIVEQYISNKTYYDSVLKQIATYNKFNPDSLPKESIPIDTTKNVLPYIK